MKDSAQKISPWGAGFVVVCLISSICGIYGSLLDAPFLHFDDDYNIFANPYFLGGSSGELWWKPYYGMYIPATSAVWSALFSWGQGHVLPFRILNLFLHFANTYLVWKILIFWAKKYQVQETLAPVFALAYFALHPLQVDAVAWITGARDLLSCFWALLAVLCYFRFPNWRGSLFSTLLFLLAVLSKPNVVTVPLAIFFFQKLEKEKIDRRSMLTLLGWMMISIAIVIVTTFIQNEVDFPYEEWWKRPLIALTSFGFYFQKIFYPLNLAVDYGRTPEYILSSFYNWLPATAACVGVVYFIYHWRLRLAWLWFALMLPVSGLVGFAYQKISSVADHYNYLSLAVVAGVFMILLDRLVRFRRARSLAIGLAALLIAGFSFQSWSQVKYWKGDLEFFTEMHRANPLSYAAAIGLSYIFCERPLTAPQGLEIVEQLLERKPGDLLGLANKVFCLYNLERWSDVVAVEKSLTNPGLVRQLDLHAVAAASLFGTLGASWVRLQNSERGLAYLCQAQGLCPTQELYANNLHLLQTFLIKKGSASDCPILFSNKEFIERLASKPFNEK